MGRMPRRRPSFFKVLIGDFTKRLRIPPAFAKKFEGKLSKKSILKTDSGKLWVINMERIGQDYFFRNGWCKFVKDCHLEVGDFLVFWLVGDSTFEVVTYGRSGCPKLLNSSVKRHGDLSRQNKRNPFMDGHTTIAQYKKPRVSGTNVKPARRLPVKMETGSEGVVEAAASAKPQHPSFVTILKKHNKYILSVPKGFADEAGMAMKRNTVLRDPKGRAWLVKISVRRGGRIDLANGWCDFQKANKLAQGDSCLFQFIRGKGNVIHVYIRREGGTGAVASQ